MTKKGNAVALRQKLFLLKNTRSTILKQRRKWCDAMRQNIMQIISRLRKAAVLSMLPDHQARASYRTILATKILLCLRQKLPANGCQGAVRDEAMQGEDVPLPLVSPRQSRLHLGTQLRGHARRRCSRHLLGW